MKHATFDLILAAFFIAAALTLPIFFHLIGLGNALLPMFYPIALAGFLLPARTALLTALSPLLSALMTGMPPLHPPIAFIMVVEAVLFAVLPYLLHRVLRLPITVALALTLLIDRLALFAMLVLVSKLLSLPPQMVGWAAVIHGLPGVAIMLLALPNLIMILQKKRGHFDARQAQT